MTRWKTRKCFACNRGFRVKYEYKGELRCPYEDCPGGKIMKFGGWMVSREIQKIRNNNIRNHIDYISRSHRNCIKINVGNGTEEHKKHEIKKALMAIDLIFEGKMIFTECEHLDTPRRSDIYVADDNLIIEIAKSETEESLSEKEKEFKSHDYKFESIKIW